MTFGFSRDDVEGKFLGRYLEEKVLRESPFKSVDTAGVGLLVKLAVEGGRKTNPRLEVGICGEHGGDPRAYDSSTKPGWTMSAAPRTGYPSRG